MHQSFTTLYQNSSSFLPLLDLNSIIRCFCDIINLIWAFYDKLQQAYYTCGQNLSPQQDAFLEIKDYALTSGADQWIWTGLHELVRNLKNKLFLKLLV